MGEYRQNPDLAISYIADSIPAKRTGTVGINLQVMRLGDIGFACFSGELYSPTGRYMKEHAVLTNTLVVNHCWQRPEQINGYCADDWTLRNGGFGLRQASFAPGHLNTTLTRMMNTCFEKQGLPTYQKGDIIYFGAYPQRAGEPNGRPRLAWRVLDVGKDGTLTLITDKIIDIVPLTSTMLKAMNGAIAIFAHGLTVKAEVMLREIRKASTTWHSMRWRRNKS